MSSKENRPFALFLALGLDVLIVSHFDAVIMYVIALAVMIVYLVKSAHSSSAKVWGALYAAIVLFFAFACVCLIFDFATLGLVFASIGAAPVFFVFLIAALFVQRIAWKEEKQPQKGPEEHWIEGGYP